MPYTNPPHFNNNSYSNQPKNERGKKARAGDYAEVAQDKGHFANAPHVAGQPAPFSKGVGARALNTKAPRTQKTHTGRTKHIHSTVHYEPRVHTELKRIAQKRGLSFSEVCNAAGRFFIDADLEEQHAETLKDVLRQIIREELSVFGDRIVKWLMRIAFASEQGKLLAINILKFVLRLARLNEKTYLTLVNESGHQARRNVLADTPQFKDLLSDREEKRGKEANTT
jgi:hypothetical protein